MAKTNMMNFIQPITCISNFLDPLEQSRILETEFTEKSHVTSKTKHHNTQNSKIKQSKVNLEREALNACRSKPTNGKEIKEGRGFNAY